MNTVHEVADISVDEISGPNESPTVEECAAFAARLGITPTRFMQAICELWAKAGDEQLVRTVRRCTDVDEKLREMDL